MPVDQLKIDKGFVSTLPDDSADTAIVSAVIDMAEKMQLDVVAEGVETSAAMNWLRDKGIAQAQGFYWSEPVAVADLAVWIDNFNGGATRQTRKLELL